MGITPEILQPTIERMLIATGSTGAEVAQLQKLAAAIEQKGLRHQVRYMYDTIGQRRSEEELNALNALDVFIKRVNSEEVIR